MNDSVKHNLKTKGFYMTDGQIFKNIPIQYCKYMASEIMREIGFDVSDARTPTEIVKEIRENDYYGYSSIFLFIEDMEQHTLTSVSKAIAQNPTLKYVTKLIVFYELQNFYETGIFDMKNQQTLAPSDNYNPVRDAFANKMNIDNLTFVYSSRDGQHDPTLIVFYENLLQSAKQSSIQEIVKDTYDDLFRNKEKVNYHYSCNVGCYLYNVNPALALIINHQSFSNDLHLNIRESSVQDVKALQRAFNSKKITSISLDDGSREDVAAVMHKVRTTEFNGLKNIFIVIMSHGDEGDIIYTKTGSYSIRDDIVAPLMENPTLAQVQKFVIVNACRGITDPRFDHPNKVDELRKSLPDRSSLYPCDEKLMMIFSTQKGFISLLFDEGAIFVQMFCDLFLKNFDEISMEEIGLELQELMMENIADDQIPDFGSADGQTHSIKMEFVNFFNNDELLNDLENFFKKHLNKTLLQSNSTLQTMLDEKSYLRDKDDRALLGIGYVDGVSKQHLTNDQKLSIEKFIDAKQAKLMERNKIWPTMPVRYEWSMDWTTGRNRVSVLRKTALNE